MAIETKVTIHQTAEESCCNSEISNTNEEEVKLELNSISHHYLVAACNMRYFHTLTFGGVDKILSLYDSETNTYLPREDLIESTEK